MITLNRKEFEMVLSKVKTYAGTKQNVLLHLDFNTLNVVATKSDNNNYKASLLELKIDTLSEHEKEVGYIVCLDTIQKTIKKLKSETININLNQSEKAIEDNLILSNDKFEFVVKCLNPNDRFDLIKNKFNFDDIELDRDYSFKLDVEKLINCLSKVKHSIAKDDTRYFLNGVNFAIENNNLRLISTDGHRMRVIEYGDIKTDKTIESMNIILPTYDVLELIRSKLKGDIDVLLSENKKHLMIIQPKQYCLTIGLIEGRYPDYKKVIQAVMISPLNLIKMI